MSEKSDQNTEPEGTGHEWDGIKEYNNPLPRWWLWIFYATLVWGLGYTIAYPAWPLLKSATPGLLGFSSREALESDIIAFNEANAGLDARLESAPLADIEADAELLSYALRGGAAVFRTFCSQCHGSGAAGARGYPNLLDDDWLWGGTISDIHYSVAHGIRNAEDADARQSEMPAYSEFLAEEQIWQLANYVLSLSGQPHDETLLAAGGELFGQECAACHGEGGTGDRELGAPNLTDFITLYGNAPDDIAETIAYSRNSVMPSWSGRLTESQIRQVSVYVHQLGGGE